MADDSRCDRCGGAVVTAWLHGTRGLWLCRRCTDRHGHALRKQGWERVDVA